MIAVHDLFLLKEIICLKYPEQEDRIKREYINLKKRARIDVE